MGYYEDMLYKGFALFLILFSVVIIIVGIIKIHELPGIIAEKRKHPQTDAIKAASILGLILLPLWFFALIWAYTKPVLRVSIDNEDENTKEKPEKN